MSEINEDSTPITDSNEFKLLLNLLNKAEQILSIINLSDSSISKYNILKKLTFEKLNIQFTPIEKKYLPLSSSQINNQPENNNELTDMIQILYFQNKKKSMLIDLMLNFIMNYENNNDINYFLSSLSEIFNLPMDNSKKIEEINYDIKDEESKIASLFTEIDQTFMNTFNNIKQLKINYENKILQLKENYDKDLAELKNNVQKNCNLECDLFKVKKENEKNNYILDKMSNLINESYMRYQKNISPRNFNPNEKYNDDIMKLEFLKTVLDKFFDDNKYLNNMIPNLQEEKKRIENDINLPYVKNVINNNDLMREICNSVPEIQKESDIFHKNFNDLMNYIANNIEGKVI